MRSQASKNESSLLVATFLLGRGAFGVDTAAVQEVVPRGEIRIVRRAPAYVAGIRNLRGRIVTVIDLRSRLLLGSVELDPENRILIVDWNGESVGLLVDRITDTLSFESSRLEPAPPNLHGLQSEHLRGVFHSAGRVVALLDPLAVLEADAPSEVLH